MKQYIIDELREKKGITQGQLAEALSVSRQTVIRWEQMEVEDHNFIPDENEEKLCEYFGVEDITNHDNKEWLKVAKADGEAFAKNLVGKGQQVRKAKEKILSALKQNNKDLVSEGILYLDLLTTKAICIDFFVEYLGEKDFEKAKQYVYAFLSALIVE